MRITCNHNCFSATLRPDQFQPAHRYNFQPCQQLKTKTISKAFYLYGGNKIISHCVNFLYLQNNTSFSRHKRLRV